MRYYIPLAITLLLSSSIMAKSRVRTKSKALVCLGKEEEHLHKMKDTGAFYKLNQLLIGELIMLDNIDVIPEAIPSNCNNFKPSPSYLIFKNILTREEDAFKIITSDPLSVSMAKSNLHDFITRAPKIFLRFISYIQEYSPDAKCLIKNIPELETINYNMKYLATEKDFKSFLSKEQFSTVLNKIEFADRFYTKCKTSPAKKNNK